MDFTVHTQSHVKVDITNNFSSLRSQQTFSRGITIGEFMGRLELITGADASQMKLELYDEKDKYVQELFDDGSLFGSFVSSDGSRVHVTDPKKRLNEFDDLTGVEKVEMADEVYETRGDSVRSFLKRNNLGKYNIEEQANILKEKEKLMQEEEEKAKMIKVGDRCQVIASAGTQRGMVKFVGKTDFKEGYWIGILYDEPIGKNDGSINGKRYFDAPAKYGAFIKPRLVTVGDYPEIVDDMDEM